MGLQDAVAAVLGLCFRLFADPKNPDSVANTAATTVRQVLVYPHALLSATLFVTAAGSTSCTSECASYPEMPFPLLLPHERILQLWLPAEEAYLATIASGTELSALV